MSVEVHTLSNGATAILQHMPHAETSALSTTMRIGSRNETQDENGLAHYFEHMAFKGTKNRDVYVLNTEMDSLGARSNAYTSRELTSYYMRGLNADVGRFAEIEADMAINISLPAEEIEKERGVILQEISMYADNPGSVLGDAAFATMFPGQAYGRTILGPPENIQAFDRQKFDDFRAKHYHTGNMVISYAGGEDPQKVLKDLEKHYADMPQGERSVYEPAQYVGGNIEIVHPHMQQAKLMLGFNASAAGTEGALAENMLNVVLSAGMSSRLYKKIRFEESLVYVVGAGFDRTYDAGVVLVSAGTDPLNVSKIIPLICDELDKVRQDPVSDEELERAKQEFRVSQSIMHDASPIEHMNSNMQEFNVKGKIDSREEFSDRVEAMTKDDLLDAARRLFSGTPSFASIGPARKTTQEEIAARLRLDI